MCDAGLVSPIRVTIYCYFSLFIITYYAFYNVECNIPIIYFMINQNYIYIHYDHDKTKRVIIRKKGSFFVYSSYESE